MKIRNILERKFTQFLLGSACAALAFAGCSANEEYGRYSGKEIGLAGPLPEGHSDIVQQQHHDNPWELLWQEGRTVRGDSFHNLLLLEGDRLAAHDDKRGALEAYNRARSQGLTPSEQETAVVRVAAMQLSLRQPENALRTVSEFFRTTGRSVNDVPAEFSLLFGYAYAGHQDVDQAFAWLSRAYSTGQSKGRFAFAAEEEVAQLLKTLPPRKLEDAAVTWDTDTFIRGSINAEKRRRERGGEMISGTNSSSILTAPLRAGELRLGALLPLEGRFAGLGRNVQNGIELAVAGQGEAMQVKYSAQNTGENPSDAVTAAQNLLATSDPHIILGPLISEQAGAARGVAENAKLPIITFSKRGDFVPGGSTFRIGVTIDSQIDSLLAVARDTLGITKVALISGESATQESAHLFRRKARDLGMQVLLDASYQQSDPNGAVAVATELEKLDIEGIFFADGSAAAANVYAALPETMRVRVKPMGIGNWDNRSQLMTARTVLNGAIFVSPFYAQSSRLIVSAFVATYKAKYGHAPDFLAAQGFDAATLAIQAARRAQESQIPFADALHTIDAYDGLTGRVYVGADGELRRAFAVLELKGDALVELNAPDALPAEISVGAESAHVAPPPPPE